jgi:hypothetical protein
VLAQAAVEGIQGHGSSWPTWTLLGSADGAVDVAPYAAVAVGATCIARFNAAQPCRAPGQLTQHCGREWVPAGVDLELETVAIRALSGHFVTPGPAVLPAKE